MRAIGELKLGRERETFFFAGEVSPLFPFGGGGGGGGGFEVFLRMHCLFPPPPPFVEESTFTRT